MLITVKSVINILHSTPLCYPCQSGLTKVFITVPYLCTFIGQPTHGIITCVIKPMHHNHKSQAPFLLVDYRHLFSPLDNYPPSYLYHLSLPLHDNSIIKATTVLLSLQHLPIPFLDYYQYSQQIELPHSNLTQNYDNHTLTHKYESEHRIPRAFQCFFNTDPS